MTDKIVLVTGGFDPLHSGHIAYIKEAKKLGRVIVGVNSDDWLTRKKGKPFMPFNERINIMGNLKDVMTAISFDDSDGSAKDAITQVRKMFPRNTIVFANGGDRTKENIPEMDTEIDNVEFLFGVGGEIKSNSSSWILEHWKNPVENRQWGNFITYYGNTNTKIKRLILEPGKSISMQFHNLRSELWFIEEGSGMLCSLDKDNKETKLANLESFDTCIIEPGKWHRLENTGKKKLVVIEIQYGKNCIESDITRK